MRQLKRVFLNLSLRRKQVVLMMMTAGAALLLAWLGFIAFEVLSFRRSTIAHVSTLAQMVAYNAVGALEFDDSAALEETLSALHAEQDVVGAAVYRSGGTIQASYDRQGNRRAFRPPEMPPLETRFVHGSLAVCCPIRQKGETIGSVYVESDLGSLYSRVRQGIWIGLGVFGVAGIMSWGLSALLQRLVSGPILGLVQTVRTIAHDRDFSVRALRTSEDELGVLIDSFNELLEQIESRDAELVQANQVEEKVRRTEEVYRRTISAADAVPYSYDFRGRKYLFMGEGIEQLIGYKASELSPSLWQEIIQDSVMLGETTGMDKQEAAQKVKSGELRKWHCDMRIMARDGRSRWISDISVQQFDEQGHPVGSMGMLQDITERKEAEQSLRLLSSAIEHSDASVIITSRDGAIKYVNPAVVHLTGYSREELLAGTPRLFKSGEHGTAFYKGMWETILAGRSFVGEFINRKKNGELIYEEKTITPVTNAGGEITHFVATGRDITARKRTEAEMEKLNRQLLEVSRHAGMAEVASNVLHNVGNVLNSVNVSADLVADAVRRSKVSNVGRVAELLSGHGDNLAAFLLHDERGRQLPGFLAVLAAHLQEERQAMLVELESLTKNLEHIKEIVAMQQNYAKVSGVVETVSPADLVEDALRMNAGALQRHRIQLIKDFRTVPPITVEKHKVLQVLVNLIRNAKYALTDSTREDKVLRLEVRRGGAQTVAITVADNGVGIPAENLKRIFNHGFTTRKSGHGFGLHSGALAARELGGSLTVTSAGPGEGASFTLSLPRHSGEGRGEDLAGESAGPTSKFDESREPELITTNA